MKSKFLITKKKNKYRCVEIVILSIPRRATKKIETLTKIREIDVPSSPILMKIVSQHDTRLRLKHGRVSYMRVVVSNSCRTE